MLALTPPDGRGLVVACFGVGLIGSAFVDRLRARYAFTAEELEFPWSTATGAPDAELAEALVARIDAASAARFAVLWSAGRAGFGATPAETAGELASFERVVALTGEVARARPRVRVRFGMISSSGGLFEGVHLVTPATPAAPRRPYGALKLAQEAHLAAALPHVERLVFRPSSVYGPPRAGRQGLVAVLLRNGLARRTSDIVGSLGTKRDYVSTPDLGRYLAAAMLDPDPIPAPRTEMLVSGRPVTLQEVCRLVEQALGRRLFVRYLAPTNALDITFAPSCAPGAPWRVDDLATSIHAMCRAYMGNPR